jgi:hypothetical protein
MLGYLLKTFGNKLIDAFSNGAGRVSAMAAMAASTQTARGRSTSATPIWLGYMTKDRDEVYRNLPDIG